MNLTNNAPLVVLEIVETKVGQMELCQRAHEYSIAVDGVELMNSSNHQSEDELGELTSRLIRHRPAPRMLIGGLGLGFTVRAALDALPADAKVDVAEIVPDVVRWNRYLIGNLADRPLFDPRVTVIEGDVAELLARTEAGYDAIVLDVDNGPDGLTESNAALYLQDGLATIKRALAPDGLLAIWSAFDSLHFTRELQAAGFLVDVENIRTWHAGGADHTIWLAVPSASAGDATTVRAALGAPAAAAR
ncbi:MAG: hypothetical protein R3B06_15470 [Kofleriaceae bacterium]